MPTRYRFLELSNPTVTPPMGIFIHCNDEEYIQFLGKEITGLVPNVELEFLHKSLISNLPHSICIKKLKNQDYAFVWDLHKYFCETGWKPFSFAQSDHSKVYTFTQEIHYVNSQNE